MVTTKERSMHEYSMYTGVKFTATLVYDLLLIMLL